MAGYTLVEMKQGRRGRGETPKPKLEKGASKDEKAEFEKTLAEWTAQNQVTYQGVSESEPRPDNPMDAIIELSGQDLQVVWDCFVAGYNARAFELVSDPLADFIDSSWDADKAKNFRATVNAMAKLTSRDKVEVAEELLKAIA